MTGRPTAGRGFALLAALWLLVALSVVGLELGLRARDRRLAAANVAEEGRARAAAEAGVADLHAALARVLDRPNGLGRPDPDRLIDPWARRPGLTGDTITLGDARYLVALNDPTGALHLNRAGEDELRRLLVALRVDAGHADRLAQAIMDWRDSDDLHRARGAEREDYVRLGAPVLPRNAPFARLAELRHVAGMTPEVYERVRPYLTLLGTGLVNLNAAERPVLLALPGMTEQAAAAVVRRRASGRPVRSLEDLALELPSRGREAFQANLLRLQPRVAFETRELVVASDGWVVGSPIRVRARALLARAGSTAFLVWRQVE
jgi:general secretion pathway protein K